MAAQPHEVLSKALYVEHVTAAHFVQLLHETLQLCSLRLCKLHNQKQNIPCVYGMSFLS